MSNTPEQGSQRTPEQEKAYQEGMRVGFEAGFQKGLYVAGRTAAHRINSLLTPIIGFVEILLDTPLQNTRSRTYLETIKGSADQIAAVVILMGRIRKPIFSTLEGAEDTLDLEASSRPPEE